MKIKVDGVTYNSKEKAIAVFQRAVWACEGSERERMMFALDKIKGGCDVIDTYDEFAINTSLISVDKLMAKIAKEGNVELLMPIFKAWEKEGKRSLEEIVSSYISDAYGVCTELADKATKILLS